MMKLKREASSSVKLLKGKIMSLMKNYYLIIVLKGPDNLSHVAVVSIFMCVCTCITKKEVIFSCLIIFNKGI
jgi:hypothetical protein